MSKKVLLECCVCGQDAGVWFQHWNRDNGYGICPACAKSEADCNSSKYMESLYGKPNINYEDPKVPNA